MLLCGWGPQLQMTAAMQSQPLCFASRLSFCDQDLLGIYLASDGRPVADSGFSLLLYHSE